MVVVYVRCSFLIHCQKPNITMQPSPSLLLASKLYIASQGWYCCNSSHQNFEGQLGTHLSSISQFFSEPKRRRRRRKKKRENQLLTERYPTRPPPKQPPPLLVAKKQPASYIPCKGDNATASKLLRLTHQDCSGVTRERIDGGKSSDRWQQMPLPQIHSH